MGGVGVEGESMEKNGDGGDRVVPSSQWPHPPLSTGRGLRFLVFGHKGWIGQQLSVTLRDRGHYALGSECRADDRRAVLAELARVKPDRVISCIGRTHGPGCGTIDWLEKPERLKDNVRDNLFAPVLLALACVSFGVHLTYIGTGCIYTYDEEVPVPTGHPHGAAAALAVEKEEKERKEEEEEVGDCPGGNHHRGLGRKKEGKGEEEQLEANTFSEGDRPNFFGSAYSTVKGYTDGIMQAIADLGIGIQRETMGGGKRSRREGLEGDLREGLVLTLRIRMPICGYHHSRDFITKLTKYEKICSVPNR